MKLRRASPPVPVRHNYDSTRFAGEPCPICGIRLVAIIQYPICLRCRQKYHLTEDLLKRLEAHRLIITQEVINWQQEPPTIDGQIDGIPWQASYIKNKWSAKIQEVVEGTAVLSKLIEQYLNNITPGWLRQADKKQTKIRRYYFIVALGVSLATAGFFLKRYADRLAKERQEAEEE